MKKALIYGLLSVVLASCATAISTQPPKASQPLPSLKGHSSLAVFAFVRDESVKSGFSQVSSGAEFENVVRQVVPSLTLGRKIEFLEPPSNLQVKGFSPEERRKIFGALGQVHADRVMGLYVVRPAGFELWRVIYFPWMVLTGATLGIVPLYRSLPISTGIVVWDQSGNELYSQTIAGDMHQWFWTPLLFFKGTEPNVIGAHNNADYDIFSGSIMYLTIGAEKNGALGDPAKK